MNRKIGVVILALVAVLCLSLFACDTTKPTSTKAEALQKYVFSYDDKVVKEDFTLPRRIGDYRATWTSDSEYVVLTKRADDYLATVTIPEEDAEANLKVDLRGASDTYKVRLQAITVQDFIDNYSFAQDKGIVYQNFALDTEATYKGKTATIEWSVEDTSYINVVGNECVVSPSSLNPSVTIYATFTYKGVSSRTFYNFTVSETMEHLQEVNYWYTNTGVSITMKGYVVAIATAWSSKYENVSLYMVDENLDAGYYLYRVGCDAANAAKLVPGVYLTVEGTTNTLYNGLYETNSDGDITSVDETKTIDLATTYYALDNDVLAGAPATNYNQSRFVSLTNWTVNEVKESVTEGSTATLFVLKKGEKTVSVAVSKYMEGVYSAYKTDATYAAIIAKYQTIQKGDVVSVKGLLGNYKGAQIMPLSADDIVVGGEVGENDTVAAEAVAKAMTAVDKLFALDAVITKETTVTLTEAIEGVTTTYKLLGTRTAFSIVDGKLVIIPAAAEVATVQVTFEFQGYTTNTFYTMRAEDLDNQGKADWEIENFDVIESIVKEGEHDLPDVKFFKAEEDGAAKVVWTTDAPYATVKGTVLTLAGLPLEAGTMKVTATVTVGEATSTRDYFIDVAAYDATKPVYVESAPEAGTYLALVVKQENLAQYLYATNKLEGNYLTTTTDYTAAAQVVLTAVEGGYTIQLGGKYLELVQSGTYVNVAIKDAATEGFVWTWNTTYNTFVTTVGGVDKYVGSYNAFTTYSASNLSYASTSFPSHLVSEVEIQTAQDILDSIKVETTVTEDFGLDYKASWEVIDGTGIVIDGLTAKVTQVATAQTATLEATLTYGGETVTKEYTITIPVLNPAPADGEYVYGLYQAKEEKYYYIDSSLTISSGAFATTEDPLKAAKVTLTTVEGGYKITIDGKVLEVTKVASGTKTYYNPVLFEESKATNTPWVWNNLLGIMTFKAADGNDYYLGTYSSQNTDGSWYNRKTVSASKVSYINSTNKGVTQFPCTFQRPAPLAGEYIYGVYQGKLAKQLYVDNSLTTISSNGLLKATTDTANAAKLTLTVVDGGYKITSGDKVLEIAKVVSGTKTFYNPKFLSASEATNTPWVWNDEAGVMTFKAVNGTTYYLGSYSEKEGFAASNINFITGDNLSTIGNSNYIAKFEYAPATTGGETEGGETGGNTEGGETGNYAVVATFTLGNDSTSTADDKHSENGTAITSYTETSGTYTLSITSCTKVYKDCTDTKGNGCLKLGTASAIGSFTITVPETVKEVVIYVALYKDWDATTVVVNDKETTLTTQSKVGEYTAVKVDTSTVKTITFKTKGVAKHQRCMINTIEFYA